MLSRASRPFLSVLCTLRWFAIAGQALTVWLVTVPLRMPLARLPLWSGIAVLLLFNLYAAWRTRLPREPVEREIFGHLLFDIAVLTWMVGWSGGVENPFSSVFLLPIALSILALSTRWMWATAAASVAGYCLSAWLAQPLPHVHGVIDDAFNLHKLGMVANFVVCSMVVLVFFARLNAAWRESEREVARLRERFARNEGIVALATHAASVAHELNTPLATMTLLVEELAADAGDGLRREEYTTLRQLLEACRDRVRELARPADPADGMGMVGVELERVIEAWRLVRPTVELRRTGVGPAGLVDPAVGHLLQALLNNAADASAQAGSTLVELHLDATDARLRATIRDRGAAADALPALLPGKLFRTSKPGGMGIGLALSHATVERLGGTLSLQPATDGSGVVVSFDLPAKQLP